MYTLKFGELEKSFEELGVISANLFRKNAAADEINIVSSKKFGGLGLEEGDAIELFEDGTRRFCGYVEKLPSNSSALRRSHSVLIAKSAWGELESIIYQQLWASANTESGTAVLKPCWRSKVVLGQNSDGEKIALKAQIEDILEYAISCGANFQIGEISCESDMLLDEATDLTCAEALVRILKWVPSHLAFFDYSQSGLPVLNIGLSQDVQTCEISEVSHKILRMEIASRKDLRVDGVAIKYERNNANGDFDWISVEEDVWPKGFDSKSKNALVMSVELGGNRSSCTSYKVECESIIPSSKNWWKKKIPALPQTNDIEIIEYKRDFPTLSREIAKGSLPNEGSYRIERDYISAKIRYTDENNNVLVKNVGVSLQATNAISGTYNVWRQNGWAEPTPEGLAKSIYEAMSAFHYDGEISLAAQKAENFAMKNISPDASEFGFENVKSPISSMNEDLSRGILKLRFGPPKHLYPDRLVEFFRMNRPRRNPSNDFSRNSGKTSANTQVSFNGETFAENGGQGDGHYERLLIRNEGDSKIIDLNASDLPQNETAFFRRIFICHEGKLCTSYVLMTPPVEYIED